jgi:hypothetical protein
MAGKEDNIISLPGYAFWDIKRENLDFSKDKTFIISRMFERGKFDDVLSIIVLYGKDETTKVLQNNKYLNRQGVFLAHALLGLPLQDFKAYATFKHD